MRCPAVHPETGQPCSLDDDNHPTHQIQFFDPASGEVRWGHEWPNEGYVARVVVSVPRTSRTKTEMRRLAREVEQEARGREAARREELLDSMPKRLVRVDGPETSAKGARSVAIRSRSQKALLLAEYAKAREAGLTDEEAAERCGLLAKPKACWWHRCSDLIDDGMIEPTGETRISTRSKEENRVCRPTDLGLCVAAQLAGGA